MSKNRSSIKTITTTILALTVLAILGNLGCGGIGGGGGGGGSSSADNSEGRVTLALERDYFGVGNFTQLFVQIDDMNEDGVLLKIKYPTSLRYSKRSAVLFPGERKEESITPYTEDTEGTDRYLVFFFSPQADTGRDVRLALNLKGISVDDEAYVEIGLNRNDPNVRDSEEFTATRPLFAAIERREITIDGDPVAESTPTATGTSAPGASPTVAPTATSAT